ncbi:MAG: 4Fe-4S binding protein [Burkholderiaceae bacterium]
MQRRRRLFQIGFFALFLLAPALDLLRFDLHATQLWFLGQPWSLGIDDFRAGRIGANAAALGILLRGFLPALLFIGAFLAVAWRYGRLYCGWLCPHFSLVELLNGLLKRAIGRLSLWDRVGASPRAVRWAWLVAFGASALGFAFLWATTLLTYLLPPGEVWGGLWHASLTPNQARFIGIATLAFFVELTLARHLFCRFGCAVGLFQSLAWMANPRAQVMAFQRGPAPAARSAPPPRSAAARVMAFGLQRGHPRDCRDCRTGDDTAGSACDEVCPMRLAPRQFKSAKFSCVQCGLCQDACADSQGTRGRVPLLGWTIGADALRESLRARRGGSSRPVPHAGQHAVMAAPVVSPPTEEAR